VPLVANPPRNIAVHSRRFYHRSFPSSCLSPECIEGIRAAGKELSSEVRLWNTMSEPMLLADGPLGD